MLELCILAKTEDDGAVLLCRVCFWKLNIHIDTDMGHYDTVTVIDDTSETISSGTCDTCPDCSVNYAAGLLAKPRFLW